MFAGDRKMKAAEPGESKYHTQLYPIFSTPLSQLGDFGLGFGIYFATVRDFALLAFICGLLSIPDIAYFASEEYSGDQPGVPMLLKKEKISADSSISLHLTSFDTMLTQCLKAQREREREKEQTPN